MILIFLIKSPLPRKAIRLRLSKTGKHSTCHRFPGTLHARPRRSVVAGPPNGPHLDRHPASEDALACPRQRFVQVSDFYHPETTYVLLGLQVWPVGDEHLAIGLRPQRFRPPLRAAA